MDQAARIFGGLILGYLFASLAESFQHRLFGHTPRRMRELWRRYPALLGWLRWVWWSHTVVHHGSSAGKRFCSPLAHQADLLARMNPEERRRAVDTQLGLTIMLNSFVWFMWLPMSTLPLLFLALGTSGALAGFVPMFLPPLLSKLVHPQIHRPYAIARQEATGVVGWLLRTSYGRAVIRHHWLHHRYPGKNFNLLLGGDWILGVHRRATESDLREMSSLGLPVPPRISD